MGNWISGLAVVTLVPRRDVRVVSKAEAIPALETAHDTTINGGVFHSAGRDIVDTTNHVVNNVVNNNVFTGKAIEEEMLDWFSTINYRAIHADNSEKKAPGTGTWFVESREFLAWIDSEGGILWGTGRPGAGKKVLASIIINYLQDLAKDSEGVCVVFAYCRYTEPIPVREILAGLIRQLLERYPFLVQLAQPFYDKHRRERTRPSQTDLLALLQEMSKSFKKSWFVLDGLDEVPDDIQFDLLKAFAYIKANFAITSRPLLLLKSALPRAVFVEINAHAHDIEVLIARIIDTSPSLRSLLARHAKLKEEVMATIRDKSGGMFLHASLQVEALRKCLNVKHLRETLAQFPPRLDDMYASTVSRIEKQSEAQSELAKRALLYVSYAARPFTVEELQYAVATCPKTYTFDEDLYVDESILFSLCCGLITVESMKTVRLIHYTAQEALRPMLARSYPYPHMLLAKICMACLRTFKFAGFSPLNPREISGLFESQPFVRYAYDHWHIHGRKSLAAADPVPTLEEQDSFTNYFAEFVKECQSFPVRTSWQFDFDYFQPVHVVVWYHLVELQSSIWSTEDATVSEKVNRKTKRGEIALTLAARRNNSEAVKWLISIPAIDSNLRTSSGSTALHLALEDGQDAIVMALLDSSRVDINVADEHGTMPLILASTRRSAEVLKKILEVPGVKTDVTNKSDRDGHTALMEASLLNRSDIVEQFQRFSGVDDLLDGQDLPPSSLHPPDTGDRSLLVNLTNRQGYTALMLAADKGHTTIVKQLLKFTGIDVNMFSHNGDTAYSLAKDKGHEAVIEQLLRAPEISHSIQEYRTPSPADEPLPSGIRHGTNELTIAAEDGDLKAVKELIHVSKVDVNVTDNREETTALMLASRNGHVDVVKELLKSPDIQVDLVDRYGRSALILASDFGHVGVVKALLQFG